MSKITRLAPLNDHHWSRLMPSGARCTSASHPPKSDPQHHCDTELQRHQYPPSKHDLQYHCRQTQACNQLQTSTSQHHHRDSHPTARPQHQHPHGSHRPQCSARYQPQPVPESNPPSATNSTGPVSVPVSVPVSTPVSTPASGIHTRVSTRIHLCQPVSVPVSVTWSVGSTVGVPVKSANAPHGPHQHYVVNIDLTNIRTHVKNTRLAPLNRPPWSRLMIRCNARLPAICEDKVSVSLK